MNTLIVIPARAGSKGLPGKNMRILGGKPLIMYSIEYALSLVNIGDIVCVTTNDKNVINYIKEVKNIEIIIRPDELSGDDIGMNDVLLHAVNNFKTKNIFFKNLLLLQPTSPLRFREDYLEMCSILDDETQMIVSVKESKANPYFNLFEEVDGYLFKSKEGVFLSRQECPSIYEYNGSLYLIKIDALLEYGIQGVQKIKKFVMPVNRSIDVDTIFDWNLLEYYFKELR